jgi:hypothetical protein
MHIQPLLVGYAAYVRFLVASCYAWRSLHVGKYLSSTPVAGCDQYI